MTQVDRKEGEKQVATDIIDNSDARGVPFPRLDFPDRPSRWSRWLVPKPLIRTAHVAWVTSAAIVFVATTVFAAVSLVDLDRAFSDDTPSGTFTPIERECSSGWRGGEPTCTWSGSYSDENGTAIDDALLDEELTPDSTGEPQKVRWNGNREEPVVFLDDPRSRTENLWLIAVVWVGVTSMCICFVIRSHRRRRVELARHDRAEKSSRRSRP